MVIDAERQDDVSTATVGTRVRMLKTVSATNSRRLVMNANRTHAG